MKRRKLLGVVAIVSLCASGTGCEVTEDGDLMAVDQGEYAERWDTAGAPGNFSHLGAAYEYRLAQLPTSGEAQLVPWAGYYWATYTDAINYKWDGAGSDSPTAKYAKAFGIDPKSLENAVSAESGIDSMGGSCTKDSECSSAKGEKCSKRYGATSGKCVPTWFGQCHAWAPAAVMEKEPVNAIEYNGVTFKVQDIKALMTYVYNEVKTDFIGGRCNTDDDDVKFDQYGRPSDRKCRDTNPGALHVILANWLGIHRRALVEDRTWDDEVWNQPVRGFNVKEMKEITESEAASLMNVVGTGGNTEKKSGTVASKEWVHFGPFDVTSGKLNAVLTGSGDADLYVRVGEQPTASKYDCRPYAGTSSESCSVTGPGQVYVSVNGYAASSDYELAINWGSDAPSYVFNDDAVVFYRVKADIRYITESSPGTDGNLNEDTYTRTDSVEYILELDDQGRIIGGEWLKNNPHADFLWVPIAAATDNRVGSYTFKYANIRKLLDLSVGDDKPSDEKVVKETATVAKDAWVHYGPFDVATAKKLTAAMTGTGDADLYVKVGAQPTTSSYDCRPYKGSSNETCTLSGPGNVYVSVNGYSASSIVDLTITYGAAN